MIVMIVGNQNHVNRWQLLNTQAGRLGTLRAKRLHGRCTLRKYWVGQYIQTVGLHQHRGVAYPGDGRLHDCRRRRCRCQLAVALNKRYIRRHSGRGHLRRFWQIVHQPLILPAKKITPRFGDAADVVVFKTLWRVVRPGKVVLRVHTGAARQQQHARKNY